MMNDRFKFRFFETYNNTMLDFKDYDFDEILESGKPVMQCTGLKDKNGKLIYEGDICEYEFEDIGKQKAIIYFNNQYASFLKKPLNDFQYAEINDCKVIGNIYENKELLEEECQK